MTDLATRLFGPWVRRVDARSLRADALAGVLGALLVLSLIHISEPTRPY